MNILTNLKRAIAADILKYKNTKALLLAVGAPLLLSLIFFIIYFLKSNQLVNQEKEGWDVYTNASLGVGMFFLYPLFLILLTALINFIEHNGNTWKQLYTTPVNRFSLYASKIIITLSLSFIAIALFYCFTMIGGFLIQFKYPNLFHYSAEYGYSFMWISLKLFIAWLGMTAIQFFIAFKWKNIVIPFGVGIIGFISALILMQGWKYIKYDPYAFGFILNSRSEADISDFWRLPVALGLATAIVVFMAGYVELRHRKVLE